MNVYNKQQLYKTLKAYNLFNFFKLYAVRETIGYYGKGFKQSDMDNVTNNYILPRYQNKSTTYIVNDLKKRQKAFIRFNKHHMLNYLLIPYKNNIHI